MIRLIKRYGSRKLYDTEESRYVSLDELALWVRSGQELRVVDNSNGEDVTAPTLMQVILEEGKKGTSMVSSDTLVQLIRRGEQLVTDGVEQIQQRVDRALLAATDSIPPLRRVREETEQLRRRLEALEASLAQIGTEGAGEPDGDEAVDTGAESAGPARPSGRGATKRNGNDKGHARSRKGD